LSYEKNLHNNLLDYSAGVNFNNILGAAF